MDEARHIEPAAQEPTFDTADFAPVEKHVRFPVDSVEIEPGALTFGYGRRRELITVPEIGIEEGIRNPELAKTRIRHDPDVQIAGQHRARYGGLPRPSAPASPGKNTVAPVVGVWPDCNGRETSARPARLYNEGL